MFASSSVSKGALLGMLPFAAVLGIVALGQTLVIQQAGIDLSVAGAVSVVVVITTHNAEGQNDRLLGAVLFALVVVVAAGIANGILVAILGLNPIVATLGTNTLLTAVVFAVSGGIPRSTTDLMAEIADGRTLGIPNAVYFAVGATIVTTTLVKLTVFGRQFEAVGANPLAMWTTGLRTGPHRAGAYVWAQLHYWLGGILLAGIVTQPTAFQGRAYLLPSVAAVVLGGTSLARRAGEPRGHRHRRPVPHPAAAVRPRPRHRVRLPHAHRGGRARRRHRPLHRQLGRPVRQPPGAKPIEPLAGPVQPSVP